MDRDWAGYPKSRCSTSRGRLKIGEYPTKHCSVTQATISLNSAEAGAKAIAQGCVEGVYAKNLLEGPTCEVSQLEIRTDCSSPRAMSQGLVTRRRAKHLVVQTIWVQQMSKQDILPSEEHEADVLTDHVSRTIWDRMNEPWDTCTWMKNSRKRKTMTG